MSHPAAETAEIGLPWGGVRRTAFALDMLIGRAAEFIGATLVLAETCILFAGVVSRYVFNSPIIWTDELATFLFLWLAMFGAVVAVRRDGHMRLTTFVSWCGPEWGNWLGTIAELVVIVFVLEIIVPITAYLKVQASTELITLHISDWYRVVALLVGTGLISVVLPCCGCSKPRLCAASCRRSPLSARSQRRFVVAGATGAGRDRRRQPASCFLSSFVAVCVFIGVLIAFTFGIATLSYLSASPPTMPATHRHQPHG